MLGNGSEEASREGYGSSMDEGERKWRKENIKGKEVYMMKGRKRTTWEVSAEASWEGKGREMDEGEMY